MWDPEQRFKYDPPNRRILCRFDDEDMRIIRERAKAENKSISSVVNYFVTLGMETDREYQQVKDGHGEPPAALHGRKVRNHRRP